MVAAAHNMQCCLCITEEEEEEKTKCCTSMGKVAYLLENGRDSRKHAVRLFPDPWLSFTHTTHTTHQMQRDAASRMEVDHHLELCSQLDIAGR